ncbi:hypothetical protein [Thalassomonas sp. M1454]|uniref:hypothetical protein n=1 Tax=Thalassomonas sp. M1454 TaxID=2594477 RepID=UPI0011809200|nr:hypothetical protein [Thalassomonas sp. M1454]TRX57311.1 hypothetical protein FNN08_07390 [Thalassomonas sp. M1454]
MKYTVQVITYIFFVCAILIGCEGDEPSPENINAYLNGTKTSDTTPNSDDSSTAIVNTDNGYILSVNFGGASSDVVPNLMAESSVQVNVILSIGEQAQSGVLVKYSLTYGLATIDPVIATAITNENGVASVVLTAGNQVGADTLTVAVEGLTASINFSVSESLTQVVMQPLTLLPASIGAKGSSTVSAKLFDDTEQNIFTSPVTVFFTSGCVDAGLATIDTSVTTINGIAQATYKDIACGQVDTITATTTIAGNLLQQSTTLDVQDAAVGSINFIALSNNFLALKGTGGSGSTIISPTSNSDFTRSETATLTFQVFDISGEPAAFEQVDFSLSTNVGNLTLLNNSGQSDVNGFVDVIVQSGSVASTLRVVATLTDNTSISTISDLLTISSGVADYNSFSLSVSNYNPEAWEIDGVEVLVNAYVADHFNNPVPNGTAIAFTTEFGQIEPSCTTVNGQCSVVWTSSNPRVPVPTFRDENTATRWLGGGTPCLTSIGLDTGFNEPDIAYPCPLGLGQVYGNRISILAHLIGEESFADTNGNGVYDVGEAYTDLASEAFRDDNEDNIFAGRYANGELSAGAQEAIDACGANCLQLGGDNEEFVDFNNDGVYQGLGNGVLNSVLCQEEGNGCTKQLLPIWKNITILQAGSHAYISLIEADLNADDVNNYYMPVDISTGAKTVIARVADIHNGRMPAGTTITFETGNGEIVGPNSCKVLNSSTYGFEPCSVVIKGDGVSDSAVLKVIVKTPSGVITMAEVVIQD